MFRVLGGLVREIRSYGYPSRPAFPSTTPARVWGPMLAVDCRWPYDGRAHLMAVPIECRPKEWAIFGKIPLAPSYTFTSHHAAEYCFLRSCTVLRTPRSTGIGNKCRRLKMLLEAATRSADCPTIPSLRLLSQQYGYSHNSGRHTWLG